MNNSLQKELSQMERSLSKMKRSIAASLLSGDVQSAVETGRRFHELNVEVAQRRVEVAQRHANLYSAATTMPRLDKLAIV
jgi:hypothetical protein